MRKFLFGVVIGGLVATGAWVGAQPAPDEEAAPVVIVKYVQDPQDPSPPDIDPRFDYAPAPPVAPVEEPELIPPLPPATGSSRDLYYGPFTRAWHPGWPYPKWSVNWSGVAFCESSAPGEPGWDANTGNTFYGGLQFTLSTWHWYGGKRFAYWPHHATPYEQKIVAERVLTGWDGQNNRPPLSNRPAQGPGAWPVCQRYM